MNKLGGISLRPRIALDGARLRALNRSNLILGDAKRGHLKDYFRSPNWKHRILTFILILLSLDSKGILYQFEMYFIH